MKFEIFAVFFELCCGICWFLSSLLKFLSFMFSTICFPKCRYKSSAFCTTHLSFYCHFSDQQLRWCIAGDDGMNCNPNRMINFHLLQNFHSFPLQSLKYFILFCFQIFFCPLKITSRSQFGKLLLFPFHCWFLSRC